MRHFSVFFFCFLFSLIAMSQADSRYQKLLARASLLHLQENYKSAIENYEQAFKIQDPDALNAYKAAGMYSLDSNAKKAFQYLHRALDAGWTEADWLAIDPYFDFLRISVPHRWKALQQEAHIKEKQYVTTLELPALRKEINLMTLSDQQLRYKRVQTTNDSLLEVIEQEISRADFSNLMRTKDIVAEYGWLKISQIGKDGQNNLWLLVQHADQDVIFQQTALLAMEKIKGTNEVHMENYAFLYDRVNCNLNYKQLYGTQVVWTNNGKASGFRPIKDEDRVDYRRKEIGLQPLHIYALTYGFDYRVPTTLQAQQNDLEERKKVQQLLDSAQYFYSKKQFHKTYDYYNNASTFSGGMTSSDNLEAAVLFSRIGAVDSDEKYKSIALDFLNLLYLRQNLSKEQLLSQPAFKILYDEQRWQEMIRQFKT